MGAAKAGVTVVTFDEKDSEDALHETLKESGARGLLFSPATAVDEEGSLRADHIHKLMPELSGMYPGDPLNLSAYPDLK